MKYIKYLILISLLIFSCNQNYSKNSNIESRSKKTKPTVENSKNYEIENKIDIQIENCEIPQEIKNYYKNEYSFISNREIINTWKTYHNMDTVKCPTRIIYDVTNDEKVDFIGMVTQKKDSLMGILFVQNFKENNENSLFIPGLKDYGEYGIGSVIYLNDSKNGFYVNNFESSLIDNIWNGKSFTENFNGE